MPGELFERVHQHGQATSQATSHEDVGSSVKECDCTATCYEQKESNTEELMTISQENVLFNQPEGPFNLETWGNDQERNETPG